MAVKKIIYVSSAEYYGGELSHAAKDQLKSVIQNVLIPEAQNTPTVFRTTQDSPSSYSLSYLSEKWNKTVINIKENLFLNFIATPISHDNYHDLIHSTKEGETMVVGVNKQELRTILDILFANGRDAVRSYKIKDKSSSVYALTIDPTGKEKSSFFEATYGA